MYYSTQQSKTTKGIQSIQRECFEIPSIHNFKSSTCSGCNDFESCRTGCYTKLCENANKSQFKTLIAKYESETPGIALHSIKQTSPTPTHTEDKQIDSEAIATPFQGNQSTASKTFTVSNLGTNDDLTNLALANAVVTLGGTDVVVNLVASDVSVAPGDSTTFIATITNNQATAAGIAGTFQVLSNDADENPFNIAFTANAASSPVAEIEVVVDSNSSVLSDGVASLNFGSTSSGTPVEIALTVHNAGTLPLTGLGFVIDGAASADFSVFESPDEAIAPGESAPFVIAFEPQGDNVRSAVLHLYSNDADESHFDISLTGTGTLAPEIAVEQGTTSSISSSAEAQRAASDSEENGQ